MRSPDGRIEKRASAKVSVRVVPMEIDFIAETTTLNTMLERRDFLFAAGGADRD